MTDTFIKRGDAIAAVESAIRYTFDQCCLNTAYAATEALRALPTVSVTDEMVERASRAIPTRNWPSLTESEVNDMWEGHAGNARAALESTLGPLTAPPTISVSDEMIDAAITGFTLSAASIEKDVRVCDLTEDEVRMIVGDTLNAAMGIKG